MFHFIGFLVIGLVAGLLARAIMPGRQDLSIPKTTLVGIVGALLVGWLGRAAGWYGPDDGAGFIASTVGALVVLAIYIGISNRKSLSSRSSSNDMPRKAA